MGCTVRTNRHGYLAFRIRWNGVESHEGTRLRDTPANRKKVEDRARVIDQEITDNVFDYMRWFPNGNKAALFQAAGPQEERRKLSTIAGYYRRWGATSDDTDASRRRKQGRTVSDRWADVRALHIERHVIPFIGDKRLDHLTPGMLSGLQRDLEAKGLSAGTIDGVVHSALRAMLRDARADGYLVADLRDLYDLQYLRRLNQGRNVAEIDPYTEAERDLILEGFRTKRAQYFAFVAFQFWTGARPSETIALRWQDVDLAARRVRIRRSRVRGVDGRTKTGASKRDVVLHGNLVDILKAHMPLHPKHDDFVFTTANAAPIDGVNFYGREWVPMLRRVGVRPRPFYNTRHTYISYMLELSGKPLFVARQTGTSLQMIEEHYGQVRVLANELDEMITARAKRGNPAGTLPPVAIDVDSDDAEKVQRRWAVGERAGDRDRTGDVQLGKLPFYH